MRNRPRKSDAPTPTPYSKALEKAWKDSGKSQEALGEVLGVTPGLVSAWVTGRKPVPATRAVPLADELGNVAPEAISEAYALIARQGGKVLTMPGKPEMRPELVQNRLENDIDSLRLCLSVIADVMVRHRPAEARDVLETIHRKVPRKFRDNGFLLELTEVLASAAGESSKGRAASRPRAKPRSA